MSQGSDAMKAFEARLAQLRARMEAGLSERATVLRSAAERLDNGDDSARREIKTHSHKLRGIAGTYGHTHLTDMAAQLEQRASLSPPAMVADLARELAEEAERIGEAAERTAPPSHAGHDAPRLSHSAPSARAHSMRSPEIAGARSGGAGAAVTPVSDVAAKRPGKRLRVLAMDDDVMTLKLLRLTLEGVGGFDATIVESATIALGELKRREFDVIVSDAMMPDMNGLEFCRLARRLSDRIARMPVIILSAATAEELGWQRSLDNRTAWLRKPFRPSELVKRIVEIVEEMSAAATD